MEPMLLYGLVLKYNKLSCNDKLFKKVFNNKLYKFASHKLFVLKILILDILVANKLIS